MLELSFLYAYLSIFPLQASKTNEIVKSIMLTSPAGPSQVMVKAARTVFVTRLMDQAMYRYSSPE